jgi:hypothetical protein
MSGSGRARLRSCVETMLLLACLATCAACSNGERAPAGPQRPMVDRDLPPAQPLLPVPSHPTARRWT